MILWVNRESQRTDVLNSAVDKTVFDQKSMWGYIFTPQIGTFAVLYLGSQPILKVASVNAKVWVEGEQRGSNQRSLSFSFDHSLSSCFLGPCLLIHSWQSAAEEKRWILASAAAVARMECSLGFVRRCCRGLTEDGQSKELGVGEAGEGGKYMIYLFL